MASVSDAGRNKPGDYFLSARKLQQLLDYIAVIGLDAEELSSRAGLDLIKFKKQSAERDIPAVYYSHLYLEIVKAMEQRHPAVPWAAGMGTEVFRMLCYCIIHCKTLGEALTRAEEFHDATHRLSGHRVWLRRNGEQAEFEYQFDTDMAPSSFAPPQWSRAAHYESIAAASGLRTWCSIIGWLIGHTPKMEAAHVAAPSVSKEYQFSSDALLGCSVQFGMESTAMFFPADQLDLRIVQTPRSLEHFLGHAMYQYWIDGPPASSTAMAIKSLISESVDCELPRFEEIAKHLHMSASALRRRLMSENSSYQQIKDEYREALAIEHLHRNELKIHEIGLLLGFSEPGSFVRSFRKWTGMTPKAYRDASQELSSV